MKFLFSHLFLYFTFIGSSRSILDDNAKYLDLSKDFKNAKNLNKSQGSQVVLEKAKSKPNILSTLVIEHGKIVTSYSRDGVDPHEPQPIWSATKSITSLLIGTMLDEGTLASVNETLGEIFPNQSVWVGIEDADDIKAITIQDLLTMSSGLSWEFDWLTLYKSVPPCGGLNVRETLTMYKYDPLYKGVWQYLPLSKILSFVMFERTGKTPKQLLSERFLPYLGIKESEMDWKANTLYDGRGDHANLDFSISPYYDPEKVDPDNIDTLPFGVECSGPEAAFVQLHLNVYQMAKFGQLVLAGGISGPDGHVVISSEYIDAALSESLQVAERLPEDFGNLTGITYGYLWWNNHDGPGFDDLPEDTWCAIGNDSQIICVNFTNDRVSVQLADLEGVEGSPLWSHDPDEPAFVAMTRGLDFSNFSSSKSVKSGSKSTKKSKSWEYPRHLRKRRL